MKEELVPNISHDDFANDAEILKHRRETEAYNKMIEECISILDREFNIKSSSHSDLHAFSLYNCLYEPKLIRSFEANSPIIELSIFIVRYFSSAHLARGSTGDYDNYLFGLLNFSRIFPKTIMVRETVREKIEDVFTKLEIDFPLAKSFSSRFYVVTESKEQLEQLIGNKPLDDLTAFPDMEVEIHGKLCLFRLSRNNISIEETKKFIELAKQLNRVLNN